MTGRGPPWFRAPCSSVHKVVGGMALCFRYWRETRRAGPDERGKMARCKRKKQRRALRALRNGAPEGEHTGGPGPGGKCEPRDAARVKPRPEGGMKKAGSWGQTL